MSLGSQVLKIRTRYGRGLAVAWFRDRVRPRILRTAPVTGTTDTTAEIHVLTSEDDWLNLVWTLKSFYAVSPKRYALCIHLDRSVSAESAATLRRHFPAARVIPRDEADATARRMLADFPRSLAFRQTNLLAPKVFDFMAYLEADRLALFDSDLLFFAEPTAYLQRLEDPCFRRNAFNSDCGVSAYTVTPDIVRQHAEMELQPMINSGLGVVHRESMRLDWIEEFLGLPGITEGHFWRIEQTLYALCGSRFGVELLPADYTLYFEPGLGGRAFRHYNGVIRHLMYGEGIRRLVSDGLLAGATAGI